MKGRDLIVALGQKPRVRMKRTILKVEKEEGRPLEIEVNGRRLTGAVERGAFYTAVVLLALGTLWVTVAVVLPLLGIVLGVLFSIVGVGLVVIVILLALLLLWVVISSLLERSSERRGRGDGWDE